MSKYSSVIMIYVLKKEMILIIEMQNTKERIGNVSDLVLTHIFSFLKLDELLTSVNRICTTFNFLIKESSKLWKEFDFYGAFIKPYQIP
jgi:hypothetical protein